MFFKKDRYYNAFIKSNLNKETNKIFTELEFIKTQKKYSKQKLKLLKIKLNNIKIDNIPFLKYKKSITNEQNLKQFFSILENNLTKEQIIDNNNQLTNLGKNLYKLTEILLYFMNKEISFKEFSELGSSYSFIKNLNITNPIDLLLQKFNEPNFQQLLVFIYNIIKDKSLQERFLLYLDSVLTDPKKALGQSIKYLYDKKNIKIEENNIIENIKNKDYFILIPKKDQNLQDLMKKFLPNQKNILTEKGKDILIYSKKQKTLYLGEIKLINQIGGSQNHQWNDLKNTSNISLNLKNFSKNELYNIFEILYGDKPKPILTKEELLNKIGFNKIQGIGILHGATIENLDNKYMKELQNSKNIYLLSEILNFDKDIFNDNKIIYNKNQILIKNQRLIKILKESENFLKQIKIIKDNIEKEIPKININDIINKYNKLFDNSISISSFKEEFNNNIENFESFLTYKEINYIKDNINNLKIFHNLEI